MQHPPALVSQHSPVFMSFPAVCARCCCCCCCCCSSSWSSSSQSSCPPCSGTALPITPLSALLSRESTLLLAGKSGTSWRSARRLVKGPSERGMWSGPLTPLDAGSPV
eukprot:356165-Pelagomonas_calceolata.AAC.1